MIITPKRKTRISQHPLTSYLQPTRAAIHAALKPLPLGLREFVLFGLKMAWSCLFGAAFLALMVVTHLWWPKDAPLYRYDFLLLAAIVIQAVMLWTRLETWDELKVIMAYHVIGTVMEIFKTHMGSWTYPEEAIFRIGGVPLFTGFMYGTIGSFIARALRVFDMRLSDYPNRWVTYGLALGLYVNFFTHHFISDFRTVLLVITAFTFWRTVIYFRIDQRHLSMPFLLAGTLTAFFVWVAENVGTLTRTWAYPSADGGWHLVSLNKMGAWGMLLIISFVVVTVVVKVGPPDRAHRYFYLRWSWPKRKL